MRALILALLAVAARFANAQTVLDQSVLNNSTSGFSGSVLTSSRLLAQTFTAGVNGQLSQVNLQLTQSGITNEITEDLVLTVYLTLNPSSPLGTPLTTVNISPIAVPSNPETLAGVLTSVDLSALNIQVNAGMLYSLVLGSAQPVPTPAFRHYTWLTPGGNIGPYAGGQAWSSNLPSDFTALGARDFGFQTFVTITPVPEPSIAAFTVISLFAGWLTILRRSSRSP